VEFTGDGNKKSKTEFLDSVLNSVLNKCSPPNKEGDINKQGEEVIAGVIMGLGLAIIIQEFSEIFSVVSRESGRGV